MNRNLLYSTVLILFYSLTWADIPPMGHGAILYDAHYDSTPSSKISQQPGHWKVELQNFNQGATTQNKITRLYPYSADLEISCTDTTKDSTCTIYASGYGPGSNGANASQQYHTAMTNVIIMPIIDIAFNYLNNTMLKTSTFVATLAAETISSEICNDPNANGVFFDFELKNSLSYSGIQTFYQTVSTHLQKCDKYMAIYLTPTKDDWATLKSIFGSNNNFFIAIPIYDIKGFSSPPSPDLIQNFKTYAQSVIDNAQQSQIPFTVIAPVGASFGSFQYSGTYSPNNIPSLNNFKITTDFTTNTPQLGYFQAIQSAVCKYSNNLPNFIGIDYWSWQEYIFPGDNSDSNNILRAPNLPDADTVKYLQQSADSCPL